MRRLAKNLILAAATVSAIFFVDLAPADAACHHHEKKYPHCTLTDNFEFRYTGFWDKFRDTVMPDPDEPQDNNPPKEAEKPRPANPKPVPPPRKVNPKPSNPKPAN